MTEQLWLTVFRYIAVAAGVLAVVAYLGVWCCQSSIDAKRKAEDARLVETVDRHKTDLAGKSERISELETTIEQHQVDLTIKDEAIRKLDTDLASKSKKILDLDVTVEQHQADLKFKDEIIQKLDTKAKKAGRGIVSIYDFNGVERQTTARGSTATAGPELAVYSTMVKLREARDFPSLARLCTEQVSKTPDWLTPHLFLGIAYVNLAKRDEAIRELEYVENNAPDDPDYVEATTLLKRLKREKR